MNLSHLIQGEPRALKILLDTLQNTFLVCLDAQGRLLAWNRAFAGLFPFIVDFKGRPLKDLMGVPSEEKETVFPELQGTEPQTHVLCLKHARHHFRCVTLAVACGTLMIGERLHYSEDQVFNTLSQLTNEMASVHMKLVQKHRELQVAYGKIEHISRTDPLTDLPNRRSFMDRLEDMLLATAPGEEGFSLVLFDLDHFKQINDLFGHDAGDQVLCRFAELLKKYSRKSDLPARFGGEEFIALLPDTTIKEAWVFAERIRRELAASRLLKDKHRVTVSAGVCGYANPLSREELIKQADMALYDAKNTGRNRISIYSSRP